MEQIPTFVTRLLAGPSRLLLAAILCALSISSAAMGREAIVQFIPPNNAPVDNYELLLQDETSGEQTQYQLGFVPPDADGIARTALMVDDQHSYVVTMTAQNAAGSSGPSNPIRIEASYCDPAACDDGNPCTAESCGAYGCETANVPDGSSCDDGYVDTVNDRCVMGTCEGVLLVCQTHADCNDGDICNGYESCEGGTSCLGGDPLDCGVADACNVPGCDPVAGCYMSPLPDGTTCNDGSDLTVDDVCRQGFCQGSLPVAFRLDAVEPGTISMGRTTVDLLGDGFVLGTTVAVTGGRGRNPNVVSVQLIDARTLRVRIEVSGKRPKSASAFDVVVTRPDGQQAWLLKGLVVMP